MMARMAERPGTAVLPGFGVGRGAIAGTRPITAGFRVAAGSRELSGWPEAGVGRETFGSAPRKGARFASGSFNNPGGASERKSRLVYRARPIYTIAR
jgi:hypothetical protein